MGSLTVCVFLHLQSSFLLSTSRYALLTHLPTSQIPPVATVCEAGGAVVREGESSRWEPWEKGMRLGGGGEGDFRLLCENDSAKVLLLTTRPVQPQEAARQLFPLISSPLPRTHRVALLVYQYQMWTRGLHLNPRRKQFLSQYEHEILAKHFSFLRLRLIWAGQGPMASWTPNFCRPSDQNIFDRRGVSEKTCWHAGTR